MPFITWGFYKSDSDPYMMSRSKDLTDALSDTTSLTSESPTDPLTRLNDTPVERNTTEVAGRNTTVVVANSTLPPLDKSKLLYQINRITGNLRLCIPPTVAPNILQIAHGESHPSFSRCYKIVTRFWYIRGFTRLFREFICHCSQYLQLQTRRHRPYGSL